MNDKRILIFGAFLILFLLSTGCTSKAAADNPAEESVGSNGQSDTVITIERWNIGNNKYSYEELESKYYELYNFSFPYVIKEYIKAQVVPTGVPEVYGEELQVSFDGDPNKMISILRRFEGLQLEEELLKRYVSIGSNISCEYCCAAKTLVLPDGTRACGCAHSYAMRGLAKYLLLEHPDEYTDEQIIEELAKWKTTYFPKQSIQKVFNNYAETNEIDPSILAEMPSMVGSC